MYITNTFVQQASQRALAEHAVYCSTKGALDMLSKVMALELGKHKVKIHTPELLTKEYKEFLAIELYIMKWPSLSLSASPSVNTLLAEVCKS